MHSNAFKPLKHIKQCTDSTRLCCQWSLQHLCHAIVAEAAPAAEGEAEGEPAPEVAPPADEEGEEREGGPPKPDYSRKNLEYVVTSPNQVNIVTGHVNGYPVADHSFLRDHQSIPSVTTD